MKNCVRLCILSAIFVLAWNIPIFAMDLDINLFFMSYAMYLFLFTLYTTIIGLFVILLVFCINILMYVKLCVKPLLKLRKREDDCVFLDKDMKYT